MATTEDLNSGPTHFLTVGEVAASLRVSTMTVYRLINAGELPAVRIGRSFRLRPRISRGSSSTASPAPARHRGGAGLPPRTPVAGGRHDPSSSSPTTACATSSWVSCTPSWPPLAPGGAGDRPHPRSRRSTSRPAPHALVRAAPHLGPGVVLAVVDPGVGSPRRGCACEVATGTGAHGGWSDPTTGCLVAGGRAGRRRRRSTGAVELARTGHEPRGLAAPSTGATCSPRPRPLCAGDAAGRPGRPGRPGTLVRLFDGVVGAGSGPTAGRACGRR